MVAVFRTSRFSFNPLPARRPGESDLAVELVEGDHGFQSAPDPKTGRKADLNAARNIALRFQSAPDPKTGRERHAAGECRSSKQCSFNPLPARRPGERLEHCRAAQRQHIVVSIRSRPEDREKAARRSPRPRDGRVSIRSRPEDREKVRTVTGDRAPSTCFNPLPARRPGERAAASADMHAPLTVSIRSRPEDREKGDLRVDSDPHSSVSIRSRPEDREKGRRSRPTVADHCVSIRSRPEDREKGGVDRDSATRDGFNPLPARRPGESRRYPATSGHARTRFNPLPARRPGERCAAGAADPAT